MQRIRRFEACPGYFSKTYRTLFCRKRPCIKHCENEGAATGSCVFFLFFMRCICTQPCAS
ncbi:hypothetical protein ABZP36_033687 [Zizania latifolia]